MLLPTPLSETVALKFGNWQLQLVFGNNKGEKKNLMQLVIEALSL